MLLQVTMQYSIFISKYPCTARFYFKWMFYLEMFKPYFEYFQEFRLFASYKGEISKDNIGYSHCLHDIALLSIKLSGHTEF